MINMRKIFPVVAGALTLAAATGCNYDLLPSTELTADDAIRSENDLQKAVYGIYESLTNVEGSYASFYSLYADCTGGDTAPAPNGDNNQISPFQQFAVTHTHSLTSTLYNAMNRPIAWANMAMDKASALEASLTAELATIVDPTAKENKKYSIENVRRMAAELKTLRALLHLDVARVYAQVPTVAGVDMNAAGSGIVILDRVYPPDQTFERSTLAQTYNFIVTELKDAMTALAAINFSVGTGSARKTVNGKARLNGGLNYWAAEAALSRAYLYMGDWANAYAAATDVIENNGGVYTLYTAADFISAWKLPAGGAEVIAELTTSDSNKNNPQRASLGGYTNPDGYSEVAASNAFKAVVTALPDGDIRKSSVTERAGSRGGNRAFYTTKYMGKTGSSAPTYNNNPRMLRLSEVYLIASEAALKANQQSDADKYYNALRRNRFAAGSYTDATGVTIDQILDERRIELFCEGHRMLDLKRNNLTVPDPFDVAKSRPANDTKLVLPYPQRELDISPGLVQNPGYGGR